MNRHTTGSGARKRAWVYVAGAGIALSVFATAIVLANIAAAVPRQADEHTSAHLFQLAMVAQPPLLLCFLVIADWTRKQLLSLLLGAQILSVALALGGLAWSGY